GRIQLSLPRRRGLPWHTRACSPQHDGERLNAEGDIPFVLGGWESQEGKQAYAGTLHHNKPVRKGRLNNGVAW
ncbi:MAG: hypothetical protein ACK4WM_11625, partial [Thermoflexales bacterium]